VMLVVVSKNDIIEQVMTVWGGSTVLLLTVQAAYSFYAGNEWMEPVSGLCLWCGTRGAAMCMGSIPRETMGSMFLLRWGPKEPEKSITGQEA
jgi:hypothetical protein